MLLRFLHSCLVIALVVSTSGVPLWAEYCSEMVNGSCDVSCVDTTCCDSSVPESNEQQDDDGCCGVILTVATLDLDVSLPTGVALPSSAFLRTIGGLQHIASICGKTLEFVHSSFAPLPPLSGQASLCVFRI